MNKAIIDRREVSATEERLLDNNIFLVAPGVYRMKDIFVNIFIIQNSEATDWVLIDTGLKSSAAKIKKMTAELFGDTSKPVAIIMTHAHFDHRGSLQQLAEEWNVPVYCHHMEAPYLTGRASYPPADPTVGGGMMTYLSFSYPKAPINVEKYLSELPEDGSIPELQDWKWVHTPGHTPGHISLFREKDGVLVAGDAIATTRSESAYSVMIQAKILSGPPKYFTPDWGAAARSAKELAELEPNVIATGHGHSMYGDTARKALHKLAKDFWLLGMPVKGRYVKEPALFNDEGPTYIPPARNNYIALRVIAAVAIIGLGLYFMSKRKQEGWRGKLNKYLG
jgi:glyoxylase-like metal-dependent hydrolase (beta-lactamase superfamily II)